MNESAKRRNGDAQRDLTQRPLRNAEVSDTILLCVAQRAQRAVNDSARIAEVSGAVRVPEAFAKMIFPEWGKRGDLACLAEELLIGRV
jgi:hypothetical protein